MLYRLIYRAEATDYQFVLLFFNPIQVEQLKIVIILEHMEFSFVSLFLALPIFNECDPCKIKLLNGNFEEILLFASQ